ncbi:uncharacterized protein LOC130677297 [Microplitis mediator]|uniref:uncharacterized protein LOC130677297 n=1 Tax=Microplitis mediator TaxID=375433 RepID=UPI00255762B5|nr:uncharacterized protein LOC130677297 [Microplitis mediator]
MPRRKVDPGFSEARSDNLPRVDAFMVASYLATNSNFVSAEMQGAKANLSGRQSYGDAAIEFVQLKLHGLECTLKCLICPEHRVHNKSYRVTLVLNIVEEKILSIQCHDCAASSGGCKHAIAFIMWLHRRSEEPSPTDIECYWRKSVLSQVGSSIKFIMVKDFASTEESIVLNKPFNALEEFVKRTNQKTVQSQILKYFNDVNNEQSLSIHNLLVNFINEGGTSYDEFLTLSKSRMSKDLCERIEKMTQDQANCELWFTLRYERVTASKAYEASRCNTPNGILVELLVGGKKLRDTKAMERGKKIEAMVLQQVEQKMKKKLNKCGLFLSEKYPYLGASPDAIDDEFVIEIKCPTSDKSARTYIDTNNYDKVAMKYITQMQMEMLFAGRKKAMFVVADPNFEDTKAFKSIIINYDSQLINKLLEDLSKFWKKCIFKRLFNSLYKTEQ